LGKNVLVIGAGIVGCSAALWLQRDGHQVTDVDKKGPGEGASFGNASLIATESCIPVATPASCGTCRNILAIRSGRSRSAGPICRSWRLAVALRAVERRGHVEQTSVALSTLLTEAWRRTRTWPRRRVSATSSRTPACSVSTKARSFQGSQWDRELQRRRGIKIEILQARKIASSSRACCAGQARVYLPRDPCVLDNYRLVRSLAEDITRNGGACHRRIRDFEIGAMAQSGDR
jgi:D-amino-acid dehydrogenase